MRRNPRCQRTQSPRPETRRRPYPTRDRQVRSRLARQSQTSTSKTPSGIIDAIIAPPARCRFLTMYLPEFGTTVVVLMSHSFSKELFHEEKARRSGGFDALFPEPDEIRGATLHQVGKHDCAVSVTEGPPNK